MKWISKTDKLKPFFFEINFDPSVGYYFYVFKDKQCIEDYLQDSLELTFDFAYEQYKVPKNSWYVNYT